MGIIGNFFSREDEYEEMTSSGDTLVVIEQEHEKTADVVPVTDINHERVLAGGLGRQSYSIPIEDLKVFTGQQGRIFIYNAPAELIKETKRLASLEKSIVLRQITNYREKEEEQQGIDLKSLIMIGALIFISIILAFKA